MHDRFPDLATAAEQLPQSPVRALVVRDTAADRLPFEALQRSSAGQPAARGRTATALAAKNPAFFIAFDTPADRRHREGAT
ncbi:hypothetical protein B6R96_00160 [Streptomyces sp. Sge12]|nr:hypothetical protein B6R96_00160 [Streptomyces sp. Sge12]